MRVASRIPFARPNPPPVARVPTVRRERAEPTRRDTLESFEDASDNYYLFFGLIFLVLLIFALSPGVLLTLPPGRGGIWMSGNTSTAAAFVHALLLVAVLYLI